MQSLINLHKSNLGLKEKYCRFMKELIFKSYLKNYESVEILGQNFLENLFVTVFETKKQNSTFRYLLIENIKKSVIYKLKILPNLDGYIVFCKQDFAKKLPLNIRRKFAKRGIAMTYERGLKDSKSFCFHRLISSLYYNCLNLEIHHIDKNKHNNFFENLVPLTAQKHKEIENNINCIKLSLEEKSNLANKTKSKITLAKNEDLIMEILNLKLQNKSLFETEKLINYKIKKSKIAEIISFFYYSKDFLKWLKHQQ